MFCILHKWFISRSMDTARPLPRLVARHLSRCQACARFARQCLDIAARLSSEAHLETSNEVSEELHAKILRRCRPAAGLARERTAAPRLLRLPRPAVALTAAAAIVLLAVAGVYFYPKSAPPVEGSGVSPAKPQAVAWLLMPRPLSAGSSVIENVFQRPVEDEIRLLQQDGRAAVEFLLACIPLEIDPRRREPSPLTQPTPNGG